MSDESEPRIRGFHAACGAGVWIGFREYDKDRARWHLSFHQTETGGQFSKCRSCGDPLSSEGVLSGLAMDALRSAARERSCSGAPLDAQTVALMSSEMEEGYEFELVAALYGFAPEALRLALAAFLPAETSTSETAPTA